MDSKTAGLLADFVRGGGSLVVEGAWPKRNERGEELQFLGLGGPPKSENSRDGFVSVELGKGFVLWSPSPVARSEAGEESQEAIVHVRFILATRLRPAVEASPRMPLAWKSWAKEGGIERKEETRNPVEAHLHEGGGVRLLFVVNLHERVVDAEIRFREILSGQLKEIGGMKQTLALLEGKAAVSMDRKSVRIFRL